MTEPQTPTFTVEAVDWRDIGYQLAAGLAKLLVEIKADDSVVATLAKKEGAVQALLLEWAADVALKAGELLHKLEAPAFPLIASFVAPMVQGLFGAEVNEKQFARRMAKGDGHAAAQAIVAGFLAAIEGDTPRDLAPGPQGGARVASAAVAASLESTFNAIVPEILSDLLPFDIGHFKELTELPENIIRALGVGRLVRRAVGPLVTVCAATPMEWHVNKKYTPTLLSPGTAVQQILRGQGKADEWREDLRRQGYSEKRIDALLNQGRKFFSPGDVRTFLAREKWTGVEALQHLRDQGYDEKTATDALHLEGLRRFEQLEGQEASLLVNAYASRDIDRPEFIAALGTHVAPAAEKALYAELGALKRALNVKRLTLSQVEAMVKSRVLSMVDYRATAEREGYPLEDRTALELQLRWEMEREKDIAEHRAEMEAERAAAKVAHDAALAARKAEIERQRALARRGGEADLERAVVRGQIPIARLEDVYAARYDTDTVQILVGLVEDDRQAYLERQAAADEARKRGARRSVDVGGLERALYANQLTAAELRQRLGALGFDGGDADLLTATAVAHKAELDAARKRRDDAEKTAKKRQIDLGRFERLVRKGARTMAQYVDLLQSLDVDEAAIPDFVDALQVQIDDDAAARAERDKAEPRLQARGLSLEQLRRAVVLGVRTVDDYQTFLVANNFTSDAQAVLLAEVRADVTEAEVARKRRDAATPAAATPGSPLSVIRRAAQLGLVSPDVYVDRLARAGYSQDDIDIEVELLLVEIADTQAARAKRDAPAPAGAPAGLSLAEAERAVKTGALSVEGYRARAVELGRSAADAAVLVDVLERERQTLSAARKAHDDVGLQLAAAGLPLAELEASVKSGAVSIVDYSAQLEAWGVESDDAQLIGAFMAFTVDSSTAKGGGPHADVRA